MSYILFLLMAVACVSCSNDCEPKDLHFGPGPEGEEARAESREEGIRPS